VVPAWAFNVVGSVDLLYAFYQGNRTSIAFAPGLQGAAYFIAIVLVPLLLITHGLVFRLLLRRTIAVPSLSARRAAWFSVRSRWAGFRGGGRMLFLVELDHVKSGAPLVVAQFENRAVGQFDGYRG
jgi:hypothetical protein